MRVVELKSRIKYCLLADLINKIAFTPPVRLDVGHLQVDHVVSLDWGWCIHMYSRHIVIGYCTSFWGLLYNEAAASTSPAALKIFGFVMTTSTGYFHSITRPQTVDTKVLASEAREEIERFGLLLSRRVWTALGPFDDRTELEKLTQECALSSKVLAEIWHHNQRQKKLQLL